MKLAAARVYRAMGAFINNGPAPGPTFHILTEGSNNIAAENGDLLITE